MKNILLLGCVISFFISCKPADLRFDKLENHDELKATFYGRSVKSTTSEQEDKDVLYLFNNYSADIFQPLTFRLELEDKNTLNLFFINDSLNETKMSFKGKLRKHFFKIKFARRFFEIPLIYSDSYIHKLKVGINKDGNLILDKKWSYSKTILNFGPSRSYNHRFLYLPYDSLQKPKPIQTNSGFGALNTENQIIIPPNFDYVTSFYDNFFKVISDKKEGIYTLEGKEIIPPKYDKIFYFKDNIKNPVFIIHHDNKFGIIDYTGKEIAPIQYDKITQVGDFFKLYLGTELTICTSGGVHFPPIYNDASYEVLGSSIKECYRGLGEHINQSFLFVQKEDNNFYIDDQGFEYDTFVKYGFLNTYWQSCPILESARKVSITP